MTQSTTEKLEAIAFESVVCDLPAEEVRHVLSGMNADELCASFRRMSDDAVRHVFNATGVEFTDELLAKLAPEDAATITDRLPAVHAVHVVGADVEPYAFDEVAISGFGKFCKSLDVFHNNGFCWAMIALCVASIAAFVYALFGNTVSYGVAMGVTVWGFIFVPFAAVYCGALQVSAYHIRRELAQDALQNALMVSNEYLEKYHDIHILSVPNNKAKCQKLLLRVKNLASEHENDEGRTEACACCYACEEALASLRYCNFTA
jgi:hypothetical protein